MQKQYMTLFESTKRKQALAAEAPGLDVIRRERAEIEEHIVRVEAEEKAEADLTARVAAERARIERAGERCAEAYAPEPEQIGIDACLSACDRIEANLHGMRISLPRSRSILRIGPCSLQDESFAGEQVEVMRIESPFPYPGPLRRLAYWLLLGWKWERP